MIPLTPELKKQIEERGERIHYVSMEEFQEIKKDIPKEIVIYVVSSSEDYFNTDKLEEFKSVIAEYHVKPMTNDVIIKIFTQ
jgi:hypothetical protein